MKFHLFLCGLLCISTFLSESSAQTLKPVSTKLGAKPRLVEKYFVTAATPPLREGHYSKSKGKKVVQEGYYHRDLQDSLWSDYNLKGKLVARGYYREGKKSGLWHYFSYTGDTVEVFDHTTHTSIRFDPEKDKTTFSGPNKSSGLAGIFDPGKQEGPQVAPRFIGGASMLLNIISTNLAYPSKALENNVQGEVYISFVVEKDGKMSEVRVIRPVSPSIDAEALRLTWLLDGYWLPGYHKGEPVRVRYTLPLTFRLE